MPSRPPQGVYKLMNKAPLSLNPPKQQTADQLDTIKDGVIVGHHDNGDSRNQAWSLEHSGEYGITLNNVATNQYMTAAVPIAGQVITGGSNPTVFITTEESPNEYMIKLSGSELALTLPNSEDRTPIVLDYPMGSDPKQIWVFVREDGL